MELVRLACNNCGADIEVAEDTRFTTCRYCEAKLEVKLSDGAAYTRVRKAVERIERQTAAIAEDVQALRTENRILKIEREIDELEREWEERRQELMTRAKDGSTSVPTRSKALAVGAVSALLALVMVSVTIKADAMFASLSGLFVLVIGGLGTAMLHQKAVAYERAETEYNHRREEIAERLAKARRKKR